MYGVLGHCFGTCARSGQLWHELVCIVYIMVDVLISVHTAGSYGASLWRIPDTGGALEKLADLPGQGESSIIRR